MQKEAEKAPQSEQEKTEIEEETRKISDKKEHDEKHSDPGAKEKHKHPKGDQLVKELEEKLFHMEQQYNEMLDTARRLKAEYENFKKRSETNYSERVDYETSKTVKEFISVYDNLERACAAAGKSQSLEQFEQGVEMIVRQFKAILDKFGIEEVSEVNIEFNPEIHEALMMRESDKVSHETVVEVFEKGYKMKGKIVRHAKVIVEKPMTQVQENSTEKDKIENNNENPSGGL